jgi:hypothetical protein
LVATALAQSVIHRLGVSASLNVIKAAALKAVDIGKPIEQDHIGHCHLQ